MLTQTLTALLQDECPPEHRYKVRRLTEFCLQFDSAVVPDPYYGGAKGFEHVLDLVEDACDGLIQHIKQRTKVEEHTNLGRRA